MSQAGRDQQDAENRHAQRLRLYEWAGLLAQRIDDEKREVGKTAQQGANLQKANASRTKDLAELVFKFTIAESAHAKPTPFRREYREVHSLSASEVVSMRLPLSTEPGQSELDEPRKSANPALFGAS